MHLVYFEINPVGNNTLTPSTFQFTLKKKSRKLN